ncbi:hypothetical protein ACFO4O_04130 [Glaciecola siphonariae]|uniref:Uncharacterized protein n=1 Tax=Glaciecola siphonariae TaxID=521012 RepID=A0ABV9LU25_9ALTE
MLDKKQVASAVALELSRPSSAVTNEELQQLKKIVDDSPDSTQMFGVTFGGDYVPLFQCGESQEWLYWTGFEWSPTTLEIGEELIKPEMLKTIIAQAETINEMSQLCLTNGEVNRIKADAVREFFDSLEPRIQIGKSKLWQIETQKVNEYADKLEQGE